MARSGVSVVILERAEFAVAVSRVVASRAAAPTGVGRVVEPVEGVCSAHSVSRETETSPRWYRAEPLTGVTVQESRRLHSDDRHWGSISRPIRTAGSAGARAGIRTAPFGCRAHRREMTLFLDWAGGHRRGAPGVHERSVGGWGNGGTEAIGARPSTAGPGNHRLRRFGVRGQRATARKVIHTGCPQAPPVSRETARGSGCEPVDDGLCSGSRQPVDIASRCPQDHAAPGHRRAPIRWPGTAQTGRDSGARLG